MVFKGLNCPSRLAFAHNIAGMDFELWTIGSFLFSKTTRFLQGLIFSLPNQADRSGGERPSRKVAFGPSSFSRSMRTDTELSRPWIYVLRPEHAISGS